jgi:hypothetical protein
VQRHDDDDKDDEDKRGQAEEAFRFRFAEKRKFETDSVFLDDMVWFLQKIAAHHTMSLSRAFGYDARGLERHPHA